MASFQLQDIFYLNQKNKQVVIVGQVQNGFVAPGMKINLEGNLFTVTGIENKNQQLAQINAGEYAGLAIAPLMVSAEASEQSFWEKIFQTKKDPRFKIFHNYLNTLINIS